MHNEEEEELKSLKKEAEWFLRNEVRKSLQELEEVLQGASNLFVAHSDIEAPKTHKFVLSSSSPQQSIKCVLTLQGDIIADLDLSFKLPKNPTPLLSKFFPEYPWRLQQIQDCQSFLEKTVQAVRTYESTQFRSFKQVYMLAKELFDSLNRGRSSLVQPKRKTLEELRRSPILASMRPSLPPDVALSVYLQGHHLILCIYHITFNAQRQQFELSQRIQVECVIPWLHDVLVYYSVALDNCQQLLNKIDLLKDIPCDLVNVQSPDPVYGPSHDQSCDTSSRNATEKTLTNNVKRPRQRNSSLSKETKNNVVHFSIG